MEEDKRNNKEQVVRALVMSQQRILSLAVQCPYKAEIYPGWTIIEVINHLCGWDELAIQMLHQLNGNAARQIEKIESLDSFNAKSVASKKDLGLSACVDSYVENRKNLVFLAGNIATDLLIKKIEYPWGGDGSMLAVLNIWVEHEDQHRSDIFDKCKGKQK